MANEGRHLKLADERQDQHRKWKQDTKLTLKHVNIYPLICLLNDNHKTLVRMVKLKSFIDFVLVKLHLTSK